MIANLANPPLVDTDLVTADLFYAGGPVNGSYSGQVDVNRRFFTNQATLSIASMDNLPNSFGIDVAQKGIIAVFMSEDYDNSRTIRVAIRKPVTTLRDFTSGWDVLDDVTLDIPPTIDSSSSAGAACVASQRQGAYAYIFVQLNSSNLFEDGGSLTVYKVTRDEYVEVAGVSGGRQVIDGESTDAVLPIVQSIGNGQYFVSDDEEPFVWNVSGTIQNGGVVKFTGFRDDNSQTIGDTFLIGRDIGREGTQFVEGQSAAFLQTMSLPDDMYGYGPYLVHPWRAGSYGSPEVWFFVLEFDSSGLTTGRFKVYASQWKKGIFQKPDGVAYADDSAYEAGDTSFPALNPLGYGFETDCFDEAHQISTIGPFPGMSMYNPKLNLLASLQNTKNTTVTQIPLGSPAIQALGFNVVRDKKRTGVLHLVIADGGSYPTNADVLNRIWYTNTSDDGSSWSPVQPISPAITPANQGTPGNFPLLSAVTRSGMITKTGLVTQESVGYFDANNDGVTGAGMPPLVRTHDDVLLMGNLTRYTSYKFPDGTQPPLHAMPDDYGAKISMAIIDYTGTGAATADRTSVVYAQQVKAGEIAWL